jgi:hypothetical protein
MSRYTASPFGIIPEYISDLRNFRYKAATDAQTGSASTAPQESIFSSSHKIDRGNNNDQLPINYSPKLHEDEGYDLTTTNIIERLSGITAMKLKYADFAYCRDFGVYPNNRLIICRKFGGPVPDDLNGALVSEIAKPANFIFNTMGTSGISIGSSNQANGYWYESDAKIDDIGFWNRALTQQEINNLYNASLSTQDFAINEMSIYPNPANNVLNFKATLEVETIAIYNMLGQLVQQEKMNALESAINIEKLAQGTYLVKVNDIDKGYTIIKN